VPSLASLALLVVVVIVLISGGDDEDAGDPAGVGDPGAAAESESVPGVPVPVVDIVDGDTIEVRIEGEIEDVRYIGIDTPESVAPGQPVECFGVEASEENERLVAGRRVRLDFDAERRDRYGRLLAYVYVGERFINAELVRGGFATTLEIAPNDSFAGLFDRLQQEAGNAGNGLWSAC
jgi:micrococcal nuclease